MKMKTKKIVAKRFKITKHGLILRRTQNSRHLRSNKSRKQLRRYRSSVLVKGQMEKVIKVFMPYA